jgi:signal peptidase II
MPVMPRKYWIIGSLFVLLLALDQASKAVIERFFFLHESREVIPGFFNLSYVQNRGAAFGMFGTLPGAATIFVVVAFIAIVIILFYIRRISAREVWTPVSFALILTGAVGNLIDRFRLGSVVDFLDFYYRGWHWPAFNVADSCISIGVILLAIKILMDGQTAAKEGK